MTTIDYVPITTTHPQLSTLHPATLSEKFLNGSQEKFDAMVTYSSLEHSGLGRYVKGHGTGCDTNLISGVYRVLIVCCVVFE